MDDERLPERAFAWKRGIRTAVRAFGAALLWLLSVPSPGADLPDVVLVRGDTGPLYRQFEEAFIERLRELEGEALRVVRMAPPEIASHIAGAGTPAPTSSYLVPVGTRAARAVAGYSFTVPTYFTLIPAATYDAITRRFQPNLAEVHSAVFIDQPVQRSLRLIDLALPGRRRVGVLLGPSSDALRGELLAAAAELGLELRLVSVAREEQVYAQTAALSEQVDVLLAIPDPLIYNPQTIRNLLTTTYRHRIPVIGYSRAFVTAGALAAVYSDPAQIGRQTAEGLVAGLQDGHTLPSPAYPRYFSVAVNFWVAQALGIDMVSEEVLLQALQRRERAL